MEDREALAMGLAMGFLRGAEGADGASADWAGSASAGLRSSVEAVAGEVDGEASAGSPGGCSLLSRSWSYEACDAVTFRGSSWSYEAWEAVTLAAPCWVGRLERVKGLGLRALATGPLGAFSSSSLGSWPAGTASGELRSVASEVGGPAAGAWGLDEAVAPCTAARPDVSDMGSPAG